MVGAVDAGTIVDEVGVDAPAILGELDAAGLRDAKVRTFTDDLGAKLAGAGAEHVVGRIADVDLALA